jgi:sulfur carrier protein ThiS
MVDKDQQKVWAEVHESASSMAGAVSPLSARAIQSTSSYAGVMSNEEVTQRVDAVAAPIEHSYENLLRDLRARNAVGVVVAVNGDIIWADLYASTSLLEKYWPKLIRSYAAEALTKRAASERPDVKAAQAFLQDFEGRRESVESDPGVFRRAEIFGDGFTAFELTSLLPGTGFDIHIAKMAEPQRVPVPLLRWRR